MKDGSELRKRMHISDQVAPLLAGIRANSPASERKMRHDLTRTVSVVSSYKSDQRPHSPSHKLIASHRLLFQHV